MVSIIFGNKFYEAPTTQELYNDLVKDGYTGTITELNEALILLAEGLADNARKQEIQIKETADLDEAFRNAQVEIAEAEEFVAHENVEQTEAMEVMTTQVAETAEDSNQLDFIGDDI